MAILGLRLAVLAAPLFVALLAGWKTDDKDSHSMTTATRPTRTNRLIDAASPYLLQHAHNPVDWYEWGPEALDKARRENKPIFLSIGYSACHWCHVMAHESFENQAVAAVMNRYFVNIKVDREERPDLDEIYMQATLALNGQGGWPMSVWLTPDLQPFFAGTYFPPSARWGRPGFQELCERIGRLWQTRPEALRADAERLTTIVVESLRASAPPGPALSLALLDQTVRTLARAFDHDRGGLTGGGTNKFPPSMALDLFLRTIARAGADQPTRDELRFLVELTLDRIARGGIYDQLGGGIHRYSTDADWLVPHFEKMLYDQALVSRIYTDAYQLTGKPLYARIAREICDYVIDDLQSPEGGFYSARDADSEGQEGRYYIWRRDEILQVLGRDDGELFCSFYDVSDTGNWNDPHTPDVARNILHVPRDLQTVARLNRLAPHELEARLASARARLLQIRARRVPPARDEKILAEWNGLMIASLARAGAVLDEHRYVVAAARAADFILTRQQQNGRLFRACRDGRRLATAFLTDYAAMIEGLIELYEASFDRRWLDAALTLTGTVIERFHDRQNGGFFFTPDDHEALLTRTKDVRDGATPGGNSLMLSSLLRLSVMLGDPKLRRLADQTMNCFAPRIAEYPLIGERFLAGVELALLGPVELAVVGDPRDMRTQALLRTINSTYLPNRVLMLSNPDDPSHNADSPLLRDRSLVNGAPAVYVCRDYTCQAPATTPEALARQLRG